MMGILIVVVLFLLLVVFIPCITIVPQAKAYVIERLGAYQGTWDVGFHIKLPIIDRVAKRVNLKEQVVDFPPQPVITKDNVTMSIDSVVAVRFSSASNGFSTPYTKSFGSVIW